MIIILSRKQNDIFILPVSNNIFFYLSNAEFPFETSKFVYFNNIFILYTRKYMTNIMCITTQLLLLTPCCLNSVFRRFLRYVQRRALIVYRLIGNFFHDPFLLKNRIFFRMMLLDHVLQ